MTLKCRLHKGLRRRWLGLVSKFGDQDGVAEAIEGFPACAPASRRGRPTTLTPEALDQLCLLLSTGLSRRQAAAYLGVSHSCISKTAARDPEVARALAEAEEMQHAQCVLRVAQASRKDWRAAAWLLTHAAKAPPPKLREEEKQAAQAEEIADLKRRYELRAIEETLIEEQKEARENRANLRERKKREEAYAAERAIREQERLRKEQRRQARESGAA